MEEYGHKKVIPNNSVLQSKLQDEAKGDSQVAIGSEVTFRGRL